MKKILFILAMLMSLSVNASVPAFTIYNMEWSGSPDTIHNTKNSMSAPYRSIFNFTEEDLPTYGDFYNGKTVIVNLYCHQYGGKRDEGPVTITYLMGYGIQSMTGYFNKYAKIIWDGTPHGLITFSMNPPPK